METAVVILNWNGRHFLEKYLPVLEARTPSEGFFIVVADNGSTDDSVKWMKTNFPHIMLIELDSNYGFTGGYNRALRQVDADYYILLNSDVEVGEGWAEPLINFMEDNPDAGACQPKILSIAQPDRFEYAGACGGFIDRYGYPFCRGRIMGNVEQDCGQYDDECEIFWATGACMVVRASLYHYLGGLDELFFNHMEEIDFCWRAKLIGYHVWAVPQSVVYHVGGGMLPSSSPRKLYFNFRNNLLMLRKNLPAEVRGRVIFTRMILDGCSAAVYLVTGKWSYFRAVWRAHRDYRRMRSQLEISSFDKEYNDAGRYRGSIVLRYLFTRGRAKFKDLRF